MTQKQFLINLSKLPELGWQYSLEDNLIGMLMLRLKAPNGKRFCFCPITAVCFVKKGKRIGVLDFKRAAKLLGLAKILAEKIVSSADNADEDLKSTLRGAMIRALIGWQRQ